MLLPTKKLEDVLTAVSRFTSSRSPNEAYSKIRLVSEGHLHVLAGNINGCIDADTGVACDGMDAVVDFVRFSQAVRSLNSGKLSLDLKGSELTLRAGSSKIKLPTHSIPWEAKMPEMVGGIFVDTNMFHDCSARVSFMDDDTDIKVARGQRLLAKDGALFLLAAHGRGMAGDSLQCEGDIDVVVPHDTLLAATLAMRKLEQKGFLMKMSAGTLDVHCEGIKMRLTTSTGHSPFAKDTFDKLLPKATKWNAPRQEIIDFLRQAAIFVEPFANSVEFTPTADGLMAEFCAMNDEGTPVSGGTCETLIPGTYEGAPARIAHKPFMKMVENCADDFNLWTTGSSLCVTSGNFFAAHALRSR